MLWRCHPRSRVQATILDLRMNNALDDIKLRFSASTFRLIGHSGGGQLAALLAATRRDVSAIITISANLDHEAWTSFFQYDPLQDSLNAVHYFPLNEAIERWHLAGLKDRNVPAQLTLNAAAQDTGAKVLTYPDFDHQCCWLSQWPTLLRATGFDQALSRQ